MKNIQQEVINGNINPYDLLDLWIEKPLCRSDIESLGWKLKVSEGYDQFELIYNPGEGDDQIFKFQFREANGFYYPHIIVKNGNFIFKGYIKNRSELKRLMKQLQIIE